MRKHFHEPAQAASKKGHLGFVVSQQAESTVIAEMFIQDVISHISYVRDHIIRSKFVSKRNRFNMGGRGLRPISFGNGQNRNKG